MKRVNSFVDYRTELVEESSKKVEIELEENLKKAEAEVMEGSSKRAGTKLEQEVAKKQKEVAIDAIPLAVKPPSIVDWNIHKEGKKTYYKIIRADGSSKMYLVFSHMLKIFDREDLETLWKLVKAKHGSTRPEEGYERVIWGDLKDATHADLYVGREEISSYTTDMLNKKLQCTHFSKMAYQLLKLLTKQLKNQ
ncbi:hypothetical protein Tco_0717973 [Tanacetum coccineum]